MSSSSVRLFMLAVLVLASSIVYGQNFPLVHYTIDDGLPSNTVYSVYRDSRGFIWVATNNGIAMFNGIRFRTFTTADGMPDNEIFFFQEDAYGRLWLATFNGELCYYKDGRFHNAHREPFLKLPFKNTQIENILIEKDKSVTIIFHNQEKFINIDSQKVAVVYSDAHFDNSPFFYLFKPSKGKYNFLHRDSIITIDTNHRLARAKPLSNLSGTAANGSWHFANAQDQHYVLAGSKAYTTDMKLVESGVNVSEKEKIHTVYYNKEHKLFMNTDSGLYIGNNVHILRSYKTSSITQDVTGNYWIGTLSDGAFVLDAKFANSNIYQNSYAGEAWYAYADNNQVFFTNSENKLYELKNDKLNCLFDYSKYRKSSLENGLSHGFLVVKDSLKNTYNYFNYYLGGIVAVRDLSHQPSVTIASKPISSSEIIKSIIDVRDDLVIRTITRVFSLNFSSFLHSDKFDRDGVLMADDSERIFAFAKSADNEIWLSTRKGVYKIVNSRAVLQRQFKDITFKKFEFFDKYLIGHTDVDNRLLVCSNINGTMVVDTIARQNCIWDRFYKLDSLHLLISTNNLYRLFTLQNTSKGGHYALTTIENQFIPLRAEVITSDDHNCYFFLNGTITKVGITNLLQKPSPPKLFFTVLKYGSRRFLMEDGLSVAYQGSKNISISFLTLSFAGKDVFYEYSSSNTETDNWQPINGEEINLATPHYGKYIIKVRARSISSELSRPIVYKLEILPPFWATWWFISICVVVLTIIIILIVRFRIQLIVKKKEKENETKIRFMKSEYKALNALMNPHFIFNTLNNVQGLVNRNDKLAANEYLRIFADLVRQNMHNVSKEMIPLQKEIDLVANYMALEKLRFKELMNYEINVDDDVDTAIIMVPPLFIQPLVENSIKHGILPRQSTDSCIKLNVYEVGDVLHIEVKDNGVGLSASAKKANKLHESFGLKNIQDRITQMSIILGKKIEFKMEEVQEETGQWTVVSITMSA